MTDYNNYDFQTNDTFQEITEIQLVSGDKLELSCDHPNKSIEWDHPGQWRSFSNHSDVIQGNNSITISSVTPQNIGLYICGVWKEEFELFEPVRKFNVYVFGWFSFLILISF